MGNIPKHFKTDRTKERILSGFQENCAVILEEVYVKVFPKVRVHVLRNNGNEAQAKDIYQEAFMVCWKNIRTGKFSDEAKVEGYLYAVAKNKWTDYLRSPRYKKTGSKNGVLPLAAQGISETEEIEEKTANKRAALQSALQQLGEQCETLLDLFYFERKSMEEISKLLNIGAASVRNKKYRCMAKLRKQVLKQMN